jgi:hypothetical protein
MSKMRLEGLLHLGREAGVDAVIEEADAAVVVVCFLLGGGHVHVVAEAHIVLWLLSKASSVD